MDKKQVKAVMYDFDKLIPCDKPFVLDQDNAVAYLKHQADLLFEQAIADEHSGYGVGIACDTAGKIYEDYIAKAQQILDDKWQYVMFYGNDMANTGFAVVECVPKKFGEDITDSEEQAYTQDTIKFAKHTLKELSELNEKLAKVFEDYQDGEKVYSLSEYRKGDVKLISKACDVIEQLIDIIEK